MDKIIVLDFGGQTVQLISRRIREIGVYTEVYPGDISVSELDLSDVKGIIFSGSPFSVYEEGAPVPDQNLYTLNIPLLGICYGFQRMTKDHGGIVSSLEKKEFGRAAVNYVEKNALFTDIPEGFTSWMSHGDSIEQLAEGFNLIAKTPSHPAAFAHSEKPFYGIQFHPEVSHCEHGTDILKNFVVNICGAKEEWGMQQYFESVKKEIQKQVGDSKVLLLISGGVDSSVVAALLLKTLDPENVHLMYIDTGLMRKDETSEVKDFLKRLGAKHVHVIDAEDTFLSRLKGKSEPEEKRHIIGDLFVEIQEESVKSLNLGNYFLAQGTLYTDLIESGKGVGKKAKVIKSHHNVKSPLIEAKRDSGMLIEPLSQLYKDEVRQLGLNLGVPKDIVTRHPFPGPGLAVRILGEVTKEKCNILRDVDHIYISELKSRGIYDDIWQAFAVLLPIKSVGVTGDARRYAYVTALRAIESRDGMTADVYPFDMKHLLEISSRITNEVELVGRVAYDVSSKPPATIEWE